MTPDLEATLRAALARATPLPWYTLDPPWLPGGAETSILAESPDPHVARFICDFDLWALDDDDRKSENPDADAALIVAAVNALPTLLDTLSALRAQVEARDTVLHAWLAYDQLLRSYSGPLTVLGAGDFEVADRTYDDCVATTRATLAESGHAE